MLAIGNGVAVCAGRWGEQDVFVRVAGRTQADVDRALAAAKTWSEAAPERESNEASVEMFYLGSHRIETERLTIPAPRWIDIASNYSATVRADVDALINHQQSPSSPGGRLILLHGEPGTGKTSIVRTLAREWASWCDTAYVLDADRLFTHPAYLIQALLKGTDRDDDSGTDHDVAGTDSDLAGTDCDAGGKASRWRLLVLEDCDELLRSDAKSVMGQALSRLLNLCDGVLGQGRRVMVCLTTNEPLRRLHPAVVRPRRCLANIEVGRIPRNELTLLLGPGTPCPSQGLTLSELLDVREGRSLPTDTAVGQYL